MGIIIQQLLSSLKRLLSNGSSQVDSTDLTDTLSIIVVLDIVRTLYTQASFV